MIHPTAIVDAAANIAEDVHIGPYSVIGPDVAVASGCWIGPHVVLRGPTSLGRNNRIYQFASIGDDPQDLKYSGERTTLEIGNGNTIREYVTINRGTEGGGGLTRVGDHNLLMATVHVAHDCHVGDRVVFANGASLAGHVSVGSHTILGGYSCIHQFCEIGEHAFIGLNSVVNRDVTPFTLVVGNYASARGINKNGLKRRNFDAPTIAALHKTFRVLVRRHGEREVAINELGDLPKQVPEVARFVEFVRNSERGIVR